MSDHICQGARVTYAARWLRATAAHELAFRRGTVVDCGGGVLARVEWDDRPGEPQPVMERNLVRLDRVHLEPV